MDNELSPKKTRIGLSVGFTLLTATASYVTSRLTHDNVPVYVIWCAAFILINMIGINALMSMPKFSKPEPEESDQGGGV